MSEHTGTTPPGWYHAPGDPVGTHRYWDGAAWQGDPRPISAAPSTLGVSPVVPADPWPSWLTAVVWIVTVLKAIPLVGSLFAGALMLALSSQIDEELSNSRDAELGEIGDFVSTAAGFVFFLIGGVVLVGGVLLFIQVRAMSRRRRGLLLAIAAVLSAFDALLVLGSWRDGPSFLLGIFVLQVAVVIGAVQARAQA